MIKPEVFIIGGGIGGLSCATSLAETNQFNISIFESDILGGQASSKKSKLCNTEISWRVFLPFYENLFNIINTIGAKNNFYPLLKDNVCLYNNVAESVTKSIIKDSSLSQLSNNSRLLFISKERAVNNYHDVIAVDYLNSDVMKIIIGPYYGLEPKKATLSSFYKFTYNYFIYKDDSKVKISKNPTSDSLFFPWKEYLESKNVKIYENHKLTELLTNENGKINKLIINNKIYTPDIIVFACSLDPLVYMFNKNNRLSQTNICRKLNTIKTGKQFYISINFYWKKPVIKDLECHVYTFTNGWVPIIIKRFATTDYVDENCNKDIKEVWNIGLADKLKGIYVNKYTSQSTFKEMIYEIKMNLINSDHFKNYFDFDNYTWEDYFYGYEIDDRYYEELPSTTKFSINKGIEENLLNNYETEIGNNIYFSAYYVKNSVGGASMETSTEIGLTTADIICEKYNIKNHRKPILKNQNYITGLTLPFVLLDKLLYKYNLNPITDYINPLLLLFIYFLIIFIIILLVIYIFYTFLIKNINIRKFYK